MKHLRISYLLSFFIFGMIFNSHAQQRKFVNEFLNIGVGARSLGMFGAVSASASDVNSAYWNPAGLLNVEAPFQVSAMHSEWFAGIAQYDYLGFGKKFGKSNNSFGNVTFIRMGIDNIPNTINLIGPDGRVNYENISQFSAADYALLLSYAKMAKGNFNLGGNAKIIYRQIGKFANAWGVGFDFGAQFKFKNVLVGVVGKDITSTVTAWSFNMTEEEKAVFNETGNDIPKSSIEYALPKIIGGIAFQGGFGKDKKAITYLAELDVNLSTDGRSQSLLTSDFLDLSPAFGLELGFKNLVFVRGGMGNLQRVINDVYGNQSSFEVQPNIGLGLKLGRLHVDYALSNVGNLSSSLYSHIFSLTLDLAGKN